jgi:hypothetical protein
MLEQAPVSTGEETMRKIFLTTIAVAAIFISQGAEAYKGIATGKHYENLTTCWGDGNVECVKDRVVHGNPKLGATAAVPAQETARARDTSVAPAASEEKVASHDVKPTGTAVVEACQTADGGYRQPPCRTGEIKVTLLHYSGD